jgi:hypothetical protein
MTHETFQQFQRAAIPWTALIAAIGLAWNMAGQLIAVRDDILSHCHAVELRIAGIEQWRLNHEASDTRSDAMVLRIEDRLIAIEKAVKKP